MNFSATAKREYERLWSTCAIHPARRAAVKAIADRIVANRARYERAGQPHGVPWYVVGIVHMLESSGNFGTHLHNGDPLSARTVRHPPGRPKAGSPPFTWEASASDALVFTGLDRWKDWSLAGTLYVFEKYNGFGYRSRSINSPYLWSFSGHYSKGKFVADGRFSATAVSEQCGAAVLLLELVRRGVVSLAGANGQRPNGGGGGGDVVLRRGSRGESVVALKKQLRTWYETAWPGEWEKLRIADNDVFGAQLERAVKTFQARAGLDDDGEVGPLTRAALAVPPVAAGAAAGIAAGAAVAKVKDLAHPGDLARGAKGEKVRLVQGWLSLHRFHVAVDGGFGPATETALKAFQAKRGLPASGVVDAQTWSQLVAPMVAALTPLQRRGALGGLVVAYAKQHLKQHPREVGGQNRGPWVRLYTDGREGDDFPWCAGFATTILKQACETLGVPMPVEKTLACDRMADTAGTRFVRGSAADARARLRPGSFFLQQATGAERQRYRYRHTGIVVAVGPETMATIEGNTNDDGSAEGYEVCARTRGYKNMDFVVV